MLQSIKRLYGRKLGASDGELGRIKDFYFDDPNWAVRYIVVDIGLWLQGRQVLLSPHVFHGSSLESPTIGVNLTRDQIQDSPAVESHKPISRQFEEEYYRYYGLPDYWQGEGLWGGTRGFPILEPRPKTIAVRADGPDAHLRSTQAVSGYHIMASDGITGHVCDFIMEPKSWAIDRLVVKTGHRFTGKEVQIPVSLVERISYKESTVFVKMTREAIEQSPEYQLIAKETDGRPALAA
jgi:sporulation protein YlmC with PRC-barrel domain